MFLLTVRKQSCPTAMINDCIVISLEMEKKHKIMYAKMRETLLRVIFPVMALREAVVVVEDVDGHSQDKFVQVCHLQAAVSVTGIEFST